MEERLCVTQGPLRRGRHVVVLTRRAASRPAAVADRCGATSPPMTEPENAAPERPRPKVFLQTFGCQMNFLDSELVRGRPAARRCVFTDRRDEADVIAFNTCAVRDHAEEAGPPPAARAQAAEAAPSRSGGRGARLAWRSARAARC